MIPDKYSHELLVFDYAPKLKIVGTYHALNAQDKGDLEALINKADFVALESDEQRIDGNVPTICISIPYRITRWDSSSQTLTTNLFDLAYFALFVHFNDHQIAAFNKEGKKGRTPVDSEFEYCNDVAKTLGKPVYLVDTPFYAIFEKLSSLNPIIKLAHVFTTAFRIPDPEEVDRILCDDREQYMLRQIELKEGKRIHLLSKKGLLVVGYDHAANYLRNAGLAGLGRENL